MQFVEVLYKLLLILHQLNLPFLSKLIVCAMDSNLKFSSVTISTILMDLILFAVLTAN